MIYFDRKVTAISVLLLGTSIVGCGGDSEPDTNAAAPAVTVVSPRLLSVATFINQSETADYTTTISYDENGRVLEEIVSYPDLAPFVEVTFEYNNEKLVSVTYPSGVDTYNYDNNRLISIDTVSASMNSQQLFSYDSDGKLVQTTGNAAFDFESLECTADQNMPAVFNLEYDSQNRVTSVMGDQANYQVLYEYTNDGQLSKETTTGDCLYTPVVTELEYNASGQISVWELAEANETFTYSYIYDDAGILQSETWEDTRADGSVGMETLSYEYNSDGTIIATTETDDVAVITTRYQYEEKTCLAETSPNPESQIVYGHYRFVAASIPEIQCGYLGGY